MSNIISFPNLGLSFNVNRVAFTIFGLDVMWYGVLIGIGMIIAMAYGLCEVRKTKMSQDDFLNMAIIAFPCAIVGARLYYVSFNFKEYLGDLSSVFAIRQGGLAIYGGIIAAALVILIYCRVKKINIGIPFDILAVGLPIGQAVGRWGNFVNGEAYGRATSLPWAMSIGDYAKTVHPTFLYESIWNVLGVILILCFKKHKKFEGELFCLYMLWYGIGRFLIEGLRTDSLYLGIFRVSQLVSLALIILGSTIIIYKRKKYKNK